MSSARSKRPNFLIILADDLGYSDIGCYGGEINTPNIDKLAAEGLRFSDYHTAAVCSPTRAMLMSGTDCHLAGLGVMAEYKGTDPERYNRKGFEGYMTHDVVSMPELLKDAGYQTMISGKWHLGYRRGFIPSDRGFDDVLSLLPGCHNHFGWEPYWQSQGWEGMPRIAGHQANLYVKGDQKWQPEPNTTNSPGKFYSSEFFANQLVDFLKTREQDKPFFAYLPFTAPHQPLQCLPQDREKYKGKYDEGPVALRARRLKRLAELGFIDPDVIPHDVMARIKEWEELTPEEKKLTSGSYECYAGMVECIDRSTGTVIDYLKETGELDNTVVMFFSDNGAEGASIELAPVMGPKLLETIANFYDNSYDNLGNHNSFAWLGPRWAQASTAPNRLMKHYATEGGIRVPMVVRYPPFNNHLSPGSISHSFTTVMDIMPTVLSLAGVAHPNPSGEVSRKGKAPWKEHMVYPMSGKDWSPYFRDGKFASPYANEETQGKGREKLFTVQGEQDAIHGKHDPPVGWEMHGRASVRKGNWKIVNMPVADWGTGEWQLYDLSVDQGEVHDLAKERPDKLAELLEYWTCYQEETGAGLLPKPIVKGQRESLLPDQIGGDPTEDVRNWMMLSNGSTLQATA